VLVHEYAPTSMLQRLANDSVGLWGRAARADKLVAVGETIGGFERSDGLRVHLRRGTDATHYDFLRSAPALELLRGALLQDRSWFDASSHARDVMRALDVLGVRLAEVAPRGAAAA
jgi:hypothetical protein